MDFVVDKTLCNIRLDRFLNKKTQFPQGLIQKLLRKKKILVNSVWVKASFMLKENDKIEIFYNVQETEKKNEKQISSLKKKQFKSLILFENDDFLILNKPSGWCSQEGSRVLQENCIDKIGRSIYPEARIVHRLDKETTGIMIIAKNHSTAQELTKIIREKNMKKIYVTILENIQVNNKLFSHDLKTYQEKLGYKIVSRQSNEHEYNTHSRINVIDKNESLYLCTFELFTGKTHQIRSQALFLNAPVLGDKKYNNISKYPNMCLHSCFLEFVFKQQKFVFKNTPDFVKTHFPEEKLFS